MEKTKVVMKVMMKILRENRELLDVIDRRVLLICTEIFESGERKVVIIDLEDEVYEVFDPEELRKKLAEIYGDVVKIYINIYGKSVTDAEFADACQREKYSIIGDVVDYD